MEGIEFVIRAMRVDIKQAEKEIEETPLHSMKSYYRGEINALERYIEFIKETVEM